MLIYGTNYKLTFSHGFFKKENLAFGVRGWEL